MDAFEIVGTFMEIFSDISFDGYETVTSVLDSNQYWSVAARVPPPQHSSLSLLFTLLQNKTWHLQHVSKMHQAKPP